MPDRLVFETREALDQDLANAIVAQLESGIETRGTATLVVSGGSTPKGLFKALSSTPIDWAKVTVLLADERWGCGGPRRQQYPPRQVTITEK